VLMDAAYAFAKYLVNTKYEDIPAPAIEAAKKEILDQLGVAVGGSSKPGVKELLELNKEWGGKPESTVFCFGDRLPAPQAAQVNATMGHALDYDDTGDGPVHPSVVIVPTAFAVAERKGKVNGKELLASVVMGVDLMCRLGAAFRLGLKGPTTGGHPGNGWHLTPVYGYFGAAGAAGKILGLDEDTMLNALGIAYHQSAGNGQCVVDGALTKRMGPGFASRGGIVSACMAARGITGAHNCFEGELGLFPLYHQGNYDSKALTQDLGKQFKGTNVEMKPYPCCKGTHGFVDLALSMLAKNKIAPDNVQEVLITCPGMANLSLPLEVKSHPRNPVDSQFSIPWAVAVVIARGRAGISDFTEEAIVSKDILQVCDKIRLDMEADPAAPRGLRIALQVTMRDGQVFTEKPASPGTAEMVLPFSVYESKFRDCVSYAVKTLSGKTVDTVVQLVRDLDRVDDVREIVRLLG
jgi:2-methylcitrate dehydratase PrpD